MPFPPLVSFPLSAGNNNIFCNFFKRKLGSTIDQKFLLFYKKITDKYEVIKMS